ncbi:uncharacterized protein LOC123531724 [Mercenaria mercenaria]|uniref:uncharacterized protein LOC123531724 n=1 Tax=Mercenaria mercenaria TaxID=6596 RepID=UPI00234F289B|nr:uncharacterized protein LOC123531724 [Mercenaria mercenaria]
MITLMKAVFVFSVLIHFIPNCYAQKGKCTKVTSCKCAYEDGAIVDLTQLASTDGGARYEDVPGSVATTVYSWNPCTSFTEGTCENVAVCQTTEDLPPNIYTSLGSQESALFTTDDDGKLAIQYSVENQGVLTTTLVTLVCDENSQDSFQVTDEEKLDAKYFLELTSPHACPTGITSDHLSVGTYIIIIFSSFVAVFFIVGIIIQKFVRKKSGKYVVPFVEFWMQLPVLIKAGVLLIVCRGKHVGYEHY